MDQPTDLQLAMADRGSMGMVLYGPLTREESEYMAVYDRYMAERDAEYEEQQRHGGRTVCPACGQRSVVRGVACTLGYPGHPGAEYSATYTCENPKCDYEEMA